MLNPDERTHLLELLRPPAGCRLDFAVGTTFSLDLLSALMLPLSFAFLDWERADGAPVADPLALLESLRRYGDHFTIFCQAGQIRLPAKYQRLIAFLEPCIHEALPRDEEGTFHPKVWVLRFKSDDECVRYRLLCLSRNLTFDRCWDTVVSLDGELVDRANAIAANHPLGDFIAELPGLALRRVPSERRQAISRMADEVRRVRFVWPEGFEGGKCGFWVAGLDGRATAPFGDRRDQSLIVSPFLSDGVVRDFLSRGSATHLVSRPESLQEISRETLLKCASTHFLQPQLNDEPNDGASAIEREEVLDGLHAKLFVVDRGWDASVFSGSFNATLHALEHNVEFMVEMVGKRSRVGVDEFLRQMKGETRFADLLQKYDVNIESPPADPVGHQLDRLFQFTKRALAAARPMLTITPADEAELFDMVLSCRRPLRWPDGGIEVRAWPITQQSERSLIFAERAVFHRLSYEGLTPLVAFAVTAKVGEAKGECIFVMNLPWEGVPEDREERILASLLSSQDQLMRYILFLLAAGDEDAASSGDLASLLEGAEAGGASARPIPQLLETMLRALHRAPAQLQRVASLLEALRKAPAGSALLSAEFQRIWEPIWDTARTEGEK